MDTVEQIVALAQLRWLQAETVQVVLTGKPNGPGPAEGSLPKWHEWEAQIRLGGGQWGDHVGVGKCPDLALNSLLGGLLTAHKAVDERRAEVLAEVTKGHLPKGSDSEKMTGGQVNAVPRKTLDESDTLKRIRDAAWAARCAVLDETMRQAQHTTSGGQVWEILTKLRGEERPSYPDGTT